MCILEGLGVTMFQPPKESFRAQPLNSQHVENIMKAILENPWQKGKVFVVGLFIPCSLESYNATALVYLFIIFSPPYQIKKYLTL